MPRIQDIPVASLRVRRYSEAHVEEFVELLESGRRLPPIVIRRDAAGRVYLVDGNHRLEAHRRLGFPTIQALEAV